LALAKVRLPLWRRRTVQIVWAALTNSFVTGLLAGRIYKGDLKKVCVPGLNCTSCPAAVASCPLGALQAVIGSPRFSVSLYLTGFLLAVGAALGRFVCGFLCPFGLIQEAVYKIPFFKKRNVFRFDRQFRYLKYVVLAVFVLLLPAVANNIVGYASPYFCKLICPAGTLEAGIPLMLTNPSLQDAAGLLFGWKLFLLAAVLAASLVVYRPFCKYLCPLGAVYAIANPIAMYRLHLDESKCPACGACSRACKMGVKPFVRPNSPECVRCGDCVRACPTGALNLGFKQRKETYDEKNAGMPADPADAPVACGGGSGNTDK